MRIIPWVACTFVLVALAGAAQVGKDLHEIGAGDLHELDDEKAACDEKRLASATAKLCKYHGHHSDVCSLLRSNTAHKCPGSNDKGTSLGEVADDPETASLEGPETCGSAEKKLNLLCDPKVPGNSEILDHQGTDHSWIPPPTPSPTTPPPSPSPTPMPTPPPGPLWQQMMDKIEREEKLPATECLSQNTQSVCVQPLNPVVAWPACRCGCNCCNAGGCPCSKPPIAWKDINPDNTLETCRPNKPPDMAFPASMLADGMSLTPEPWTWRVNPSGEPAGNWVPPAMPKTKAKNACQYWDKSQEMWDSPTTDCQALVNAAVVPAPSPSS